MNFEPYLTYLQNQKDIADFSQLTHLSYGVMQQLLFLNPKERLPKIKAFKSSAQEMSFSMADQSVNSVELICGWLDYEEYAEKCKLNVDEVRTKAEAGELGVVQKHPQTQKEVIIWPSAAQTKPLAELPELGKNKYQVTVSTTAKITLAAWDLPSEENFQEVQDTILSLAHATGKPEEVAERAEQELYKSCFLLEWTIFEVFVKSTIYALMIKHPQKLSAGKRGKSSVLTYDEIMSMTKSLSSITSLRDSLIQREIDQRQDNNESIHGLINFLKSEFRFEKDPYKAWYVFKGKKLTATYIDLMKLKNTRNALMHDGGKPTSKFFTDYPEIKNREGTIIIDEEYYSQSSLILRSIAFSIANDIDRGRYNASFV